MTVLHALILGIAQGLTEFLPISSSAHLNLIPQLLGWPEQPLVFDTTLHLGTAAALILFFWKDLYKYYFALLRDFLAHKFSFSSFTREGKFAFYLLLSAVPASVVGFCIGNEIESKFGDVSGIVATLFLGSLLMFIADKFFFSSHPENLLQRVDGKNSFFIGCMQTLALFPGVSRSGSTISAGMFAGFSREEAAKFSFMASVPIVLMAGLFQIVKYPQQLVGASVQPVLVGFFASFIVGILVIKFLLGFLRKRSLSVFVGYRLLLAVVLLSIFIL